MGGSYSNLITNLRDDQKPAPKGFGASDYPRQASVTVTSAQILAAYTTPVTLIAAPAEDNYIIIDEIVAFNDLGTAAYAAGGTMSIRYTDGSGAKVVNDLAEVAFVEAAADAIALRKAVDVVPECAKIVLFAEASNPTDGDGVMKFKIKYRIVNFT